MGVIVTRTNVAWANVTFSYFGVPNFISIVTFLLKLIRWGFLVDVVLLHGGKVKSIPLRLEFDNTHHTSDHSVTCM